MKKLMVLLSFLLAVSANAQISADAAKKMEGRWHGIVVLNTGDIDSLQATFVLKDGVIEGRLTDKFGLLEDSPMLEMEWEGSTFSCHIMINDNTGKMKILLDGELDGSSIEGDWLDPVNGGGDQWSLVKKPEIKAVPEESK